MNPNAASWMRPDAPRWLLPNQNIWQWPGHNEQKYRPDQPRVPAGNSDGGQWTTVSSGGGISIALPTGNITSESDELADFSNELLAGIGQTLSDLRDQLARIRLAGDIPTGDSPPEIPEERPPTSGSRTELLKSVARAIAAGIHLDALVVQLPWLATQEALIGSYNDPPRSLEELQSAVDAWRAGTDKHHIVEQSSAEEDGFPRSLIDSSENLVRIPRLKHQEITAWYNTANPDFGEQSPRDYLRGRSWDVRYAVGLEALKDFGVLKP
ncbi:MAG TPA: hypothetical protein VHD59_01980 [Pseudolabrys sp.]|jgi:hypothetical protein|nr:hypothetical protein [Pseudolabrys sp.]